MAATIDAPPDGAVADAKAYLRIDGSDENAALATMVAAALDLFERFTGVTPLVADRAAMLPAARGCWQRLPAQPVAAITAVAALAIDGTASPLAPADYAIDLAADGGGLVRFTGTGDVRRLLVDYRAGLAADWAGLPAAVRQGVVRLAGHLHAHRDEAEDSGPPAAVAALWRPWRRVRL